MGYESGQVGVEGLIARGDACRQRLKVAKAACTRCEDTKGNVAGQCPAGLRDDDWSVLGHPSSSAQIIDRGPVNTVGGKPVRPVWNPRCCPDHVITGVADEKDCPGIEVLLEDLKAVAAKTKCVHHKVPSVSHHHTKFRQRRLPCSALTGRKNGIPSAHTGRL